MNNLYNFNVGVFHVGEMNSQTLFKTLVDQMTEGQMEWAPFEDVYDIFYVGYGSNKRKHEIPKGNDNWKAKLKRDFPQEHKAIDRYFEMLDQTALGRY